MRRDRPTDLALLEDGRHETNRVITMANTCAKWTDESCSRAGPAPPERPGEQLRVSLPREIRQKASTVRARERDDPCRPSNRYDFQAAAPRELASKDKLAERARSLGVTIEAQYRWASTTS